MDPAQDWMVLKIAKFLSKRKNNIILFQNPGARPDDPWIQNKHFQKYLHSLNNESYFSILSQYATDHDLIEKILIHGGGPFDLLGIMTSLPESMNALPSQLTNQILEELVLPVSLYTRLMMKVLLSVIANHIRT